MTEYINQEETKAKSKSNTQVHEHFCVCCGKKETIDLRGEEYWREEDKEKLWHKLNDNILHEYPSSLEHFDLRKAEVCDECYVKWLMSFKFLNKILIE